MYIAIIVRMGQMIHVLVVPQGDILIKIKYLSLKNQIINN